MTDLEYRCVHGHDKCSEMYPGPECPYCERIHPKGERALIDELYAGDKGLFYWNEEDTRRIATALAAARREGAEEMREEYETMRAAYDGLADSIRSAVAESVRVAQARIYREGAEEMRARAAHKAVDCVGGFAGCAVGDAIMSLPLTPEEPA